MQIETTDMAENKKKKWKINYFLLGMLAVFAMIIPYFVLGTEVIVTYHDQLDGEMIAYILQAKHLFSGEILPEFMGGVSKTALTLPAPLSLLFFLTGNPFIAYVIMQSIGGITGYIGMYLLSKEIGCKQFFAMVVAVLYAYLPFLPVYGLSQYGIPLLIWVFLQMRKGEYKKIGLIYCVVYAMDSSLVLVGFAVLSFSLGYLIYCFLYKRKERKFQGTMAVSWALMLIVYIITNIKLLLQVLTGNTLISHKEEYALEAEGFFSVLKSAILEGGQHSKGYQQWILYGGIAILLLCVIEGIKGEKYSKKDHKKENRNNEKVKKLKEIAMILGIQLILAFIAGFWNGTLGMWIRGNLSALGAFQLDRVLWMAPAFWYLLLSCLIVLVGIWRREGSKELFCVGTVILTGVILLTGVNILKAGNLKGNVKKLINSEYPSISYGDYYALGVMEQVEAFIEKEGNETKSEYRVVSLGIDPAAALYAGFYCLDGYSNNYSLEYKHKFRKIIEAELSKSEYLTEYYDNWGNRCYL
ncbi:DUF6044 family protein, partial [Lachnospiraceae bacterium OttesenSCG-928-D06]|nr:DUF6044 family protein [Lachnospiraceae bacterium OttesenSCG-928-D06]